VCWSRVARAETAEEAQKGGKCFTSGGGREDWGGLTSKKGKTGEKGRMSNEMERGHGVRRLMKEKGRQVNFEGRGDWEVGLGDFEKNVGEGAWGNTRGGEGGWA